MIPNNLRTEVDASQLMWMCRKVLAEDLALVRVEVASDRYRRHAKTVRVTAMEKVASFGGTLGLFTGMSFISFVEILYWMAKYVGLQLTAIKAVSTKTAPPISLA